VAAPPLQGDAYARIAAISGMQPRLDAARGELAALRAQHEANVRQAATLTSDANRLSQERAQISAQEIALQRQLVSLEERANAALRGLASVKRSFAYRASEAWLWQMMKEKVVKPELRGFAREKMWFGNIDSLTDLEVDQMFERGQKVWNGWFVWRGQDNFFAVQDKTLSFITQTKEFAHEAARVAALGSPAEMQAFADRVFSRFESHTSDLAKTALKDLSGLAPFDAISHRLAGFKD
jgi:multidrug efflux pump subunit AcrA (membrane-fusion protein)